MKKIIKSLLILVVSSISCGCSNFLNEYSQDMIVPKTVSDLDEVLLGSVYIRSTKVDYGMSEGSCGFFNLLDDDINSSSSIGINGSYSSWTYVSNRLFGYFAWQQDVRKNYSKSSSIDDSSTWMDMYSRINYVNVILDEIERLPRNTNNDIKIYKRVKAESYFLRAQFFLVLANLYGDAYAPSTCQTKLCVPLKLTPYVEQDKDKETQFTRATVKEIYTQIVSDLENSEKLFLESPQIESHRLHRTSLEATQLLLSRVYLYMQNWEKAAETSKRVIDSRICALSPLTDLTPDVSFITENCREVIFSQGPNRLTPALPNVSLSANSGDYCVTKELYDLYSDDDRRKSCFFKQMDNDSIALASKYKKVSDYNDVSDALALRVSEAYLNYAEACAMLDDKQAEANNTLNILRASRIDNYEREDYSGENLILQIRNERRKELCFEGHRWFDLRRYAVNEKYPYSKDIIHVFNVHTNDDVKFIRSLYYRLPVNDPSYTFSIPKSVLEFDKVPMPDNLREYREAIEMGSDK